MVIPDSQMRHLLGDPRYVIAISVLVLGGPLLVVGSIKLVGLLGHHPPVPRSLDPPKEDEREPGDPADFGAVATLLWLLLVIAILVLTWSVWKV